eukprot:211803-Prymnesium_polylepis.1
MALFEVLEPPMTPWPSKYATLTTHHRSGRRMGAQVLRDAHDEVVVQHGVRLHERLQDVKLRRASRIDLVTPKLSRKH